MNDPIKDALLLVPFEHREKVFGDAVALARFMEETMPATGVWILIVAAVILEDGGLVRRKEGGE